MYSDPPVSSQLLKFLDQNSERGREMLLPALLETQKVHGFIPPASASAIGAALKVPQAKIPDYKVCTVAVEKS